MNHVPLGRMVSIDPGLGGTGWASWAGSMLLGCESIEGCERAGGAVSRLTFMELAIRRRIVLIDAPAKVVIEMPTMMGSTSRGMAAMHTGELLWLSVLVGSIRSEAMAHKCEVQLVTPTAWKGQLSKAMVSRRIAKILPQNAKQIVGHAWDAVGIGLWAQGRF